MFLYTAGNSVETEYDTCAMVPSMDCTTWFPCKFIMNVSIQSVKIKGNRANADVWTPVVYFTE